MAAVIASADKPPTSREILLAFEHRRNQTFDEFLEAWELVNSVVGRYPFTPEDQAAWHRFRAALQALLIDYDASNNVALGEVGRRQRPRDGDRKEEIWARFYGQGRAEQTAKEIGKELHMTEEAVNRELKRQRGEGRRPPFDKRKKKKS